MKSATDKSVILILFEAIETALATLLTSKTIQTVEIWNNQMENEEDERPRKYPYVAVEISVDWEGIKARNNYSQVANIIQNQQDGNTTITIHCYFSNLKTETLAFKEDEPVRFLIHRAINLLSNDDYFTPLERIHTPAISSHKRVYDLMSIYTCMLHEAAGQAETTAMDIGLEQESSFDITNKQLNL